MRRFSILLFTCILLVALNAPDSSAQFKKDAFSQDYGNETEGSSSQKDSSSLFSFREYFGALQHKNDIRIGTLAAGSAVFIGGQQIYNRQYWKLPVIYGGLAASAGAGLYLHSEGHKKGATACFAGTAAIYYASMMDGVINFERGKDPSPGRATLYSVLCPGLGQIYNGEVWKAPIYWGCLLGAGHFLAMNNRNYHRFKNLHNEMTNPDVPYTGPQIGNGESTAKSYRDLYRRYRDYSIVFLGAFYLLQAIDANVFCYMRDFELTDDLSVNVAPAVIAPDCQYAFTSPQTAGYGLSIGFRF